MKTVELDGVEYLVLTPSPKIQPWLSAYGPLMTREIKTPEEAEAHEARIAKIQDRIFRYVKPKPKPEHEGELFYAVLEELGDRATSMREVGDELFRPRTPSPPSRRPSSRDSSEAKRSPRTRRTRPDKEG